jgi:orotidine-5'-phosphate decarboxylase
MSSREAIELGADLLVIGRPILQNPPYLEAVNKILEEIK